MTQVYTSTYSAQRALKDAIRFYVTDIGSTPVELPDVMALTFSQGNNSPAKWSAALMNCDRDYAPFNTSSAYYGKLTPDVYSAEHTIKRVFYFTITELGMTWESPYLVLEDAHWDPASGAVALSGTDFSKLLYLENQSMTSWLSSSSGIKYAKAIIARILETYGIATYDLSGFDDFPVRVFHFANERPMDALMRLFDIKGLHWIIKEKNKMYVFRPKQKSTADWSLKHGESLFSLGYRQSSGRIYNHVTVCRTKPSGNLITESEGKEYGEHTVEFSDTPITTPSFYFDNVVACMLDTGGNPVTWQSTDGMWYTGGSNASSAPGPFTAVKFNVGVTPTYPQGDASVFWRCKVFGVRVENDPEEFGPFQTYKNVVVYDSKSIAKYGKLCAPDIPESILLWNRQAAIDYATMVIQDSHRGLELIEGSIPLNPYVYPGQTLRLTVGDLSLDDYFYCEGTTLGIDFGAVSISNSFICSRYQNATTLMTR